MASVLILWRLRYEVSDDGYFSFKCEVEALWIEPGLLDLLPGR